MNSKIMAIAIVAVVAVASAGFGIVALQKNPYGEQSDYSILENLDENLKKGLKAKYISETRNSNSGIGYVFSFTIDDANGEGNFDYTYYTDMDFDDCDLENVIISVDSLLGFDVTDEVEWPEHPEYDIVKSDDGTTYTVTSKRDTRDCDVNLTLRYVSGACVSASGELDYKKTESFDDGRSVFRDVDVEFTTIGEIIYVDGDAYSREKVLDAPPKECKDVIEMLIAFTNGASATAFKLIKDNYPDKVSMSTETLGKAGFTKYRVNETIESSEMKLKSGVAYLYNGEAYKDAIMKLSASGTDASNIRCSLDAEFRILFV